METTTERAERIVLPVLGTKAAPTLGPSNFREGLNLAVGLLRAQAGRAGYDTCQVTPSDEACRTCEIIGSRICELVSCSNQASEGATE